MALRTPFVGKKVWLLEIQEKAVRKQPRGDHKKKQKAAYAIYSPLQLFDCNCGKKLTTGRTQTLRLIRKNDNSIIPANAIAPTPESHLPSQLLWWPRHTSRNKDAPVVLPPP